MTSIATDISAVSGISLVSGISDISPVFGISSCQLFLSHPVFLSCLPFPGVTKKGLSMNPYTIKQELKKLWFRIPGSKTELLKKQILILIVSLLLAALLFMQGTEQQFLLPGNQIQREPIGGVEKKIPLNVTGISGKKKEEIYVTVSPRLYSKEEADKAFAKLQGKMESLILSEEDSFDGISGNIQLKKIFNPENIKATWSFRPESLWTNQKETPLQDSDKSYTKYRDILEDSGQIHHEYLEKDQILT